MLLGHVFESVPYQFGMPLSTALLSVVDTPSLPDLGLPFDFDSARAVEDDGPSSEALDSRRTLSGIGIGWAFDRLI